MGRETPVAVHHSPITTHQSRTSIQYKQTPQNHRSAESSAENKGETIFYSVQICPS
jgi:hypothetical protein